MPSQRKRYRAEFKARVALEAIKGHLTINELASQFGVHPHVVTQWKKPALECLPQLFATRPAPAENERERLEAALYQQIGQLKVELDWLKKQAGLLARDYAWPDRAGASPHSCQPAVRVGRAGPVQLRLRTCR